VRVTENQIRKIIREVLSSPKTLLKERAARDWESYVQITTDKNYPGAQQVEDIYKELVNKPLTQFMKKTGWEEGQTESFDDYKKWYMRLNNSDLGVKVRDGRNYLDPADIISYMEAVKARPDPRAEAAEDIEAVVKVVKNKRDSINDRRKELKTDLAAMKKNYEEMLKDIKNSDASDREKKEQERKLKLLHKQAKQRARQDKRADLRAIRQKFRKEGQKVRQARRAELGASVQNLDIDVDI
jgi:hypothetical protein